MGSLLGSLLAGAEAGGIDGSDGLDGSDVWGRWSTGRERLCYTHFPSNE